MKSGLLNGLMMGFLMISYTGISAQKHILPPWSTIKLTGKTMKPGYPFYVPEEKSNFPWWPAAGSVIGAGLITYLLLPDDSNTNNCSFGAQFDVIHPTCNQPNGSAVILVTPAGLYNYQWSNGSTMNGINSIPEGNYSVTVTDPLSGCSKVFSTSLQSTVINIQIELITKSSNCGQEDGTITALVNPASGFYTFQWSNGGSGPFLQNLKPGHYQLTVSAGGSCTQIASATVGENPPTFKISSQTTPANCMEADGSANIVVDPPGNYDFLWSEGSTGPSVSGLRAGNYTVTVTLQGTHCSLLHQVAIEDKNAGFTIQVQTTPEYCNQANGTASVTVNPSGSFEYLWSNGATASNTSALKAGTHQVTVTQSGTRCMQAQSFSIEHKNAEHSITVQTTPATCGIDDGKATLQVEPPGTYTILWSNGAGEYSLGNLASGTYSVIVTDVNNCSVQSTLKIDESPARYVTDSHTSPGNCIGDHTNIRLFLNSPGPGPINISANGPNGNHHVVVPKSQTDLRNYFKIIPGSWMLTLRDSNLKNSCVEEFKVEVQDSSDFICRPDSFKTFLNKPVSGNVLLNDTGISLKIISHIPPSSGGFSLQTDGQFNFNPPRDSSGIFSFTYTVQDTCKKTKDQLAVIRVDSAHCNFTVSFHATPAHCGLSDGSVSVTVDSAGNYTYKWSNGATGPVLMNVKKGNYEVSITDETKKCSLIFTTELNELPAEYIRNTRITQPGCQTPGNIRFDVFSPGTGPMKMILAHPGGSGTYTVPKGTVTISSYASIVPGDYNITLYDESAGLDCMHEISATIEATPSIEIILEGVIPPSSPSAADGTALIVAATPGALPYVVLLNNIPYITAFDNFIEVGGLATGTYMIQLRDANNCLSNKLTVVIPPRFSGWSLGMFAFSMFEIITASENSTSKHAKRFVYPGLQLNVNYLINNHQTTSGLTLSTNGSQIFSDLEQTLRVKNADIYKLSNFIDGGFGIHYASGQNLKVKWMAQLTTEISAKPGLKIYSKLKFQTLREQPFIFQIGIDFIDPFDKLTLK